MNLLWLLSIIISLWWTGQVHVVSPLVSSTRHTCNDQISLGKKTQIHRGLSRCKMLLGFRISMFCDAFLSCVQPIAAEAWMEYIAATNPIPNSWNSMISEQLDSMTLFPESLKNLTLWLGQVGPSMLPNRLRCLCLKWARPSRAWWVACTLLGYVVLMSECSMKDSAALCEDMHY